MRKPKNFKCYIVGNINDNEDNTKRLLLYELEKILHDHSISEDIRDVQLKFLKRVFDDLGLRLKVYDEDTLIDLSSQFSWDATWL